MSHFMKKTEEITEIGENKEKRLSPKVELFCQYYAKSGQAFGNLRRAYALAYEKDLAKKGQDKVCDVEAQRLLGKPIIYKRIEQLLNEKIDDEIVDKELGKVIQQGENLHAKVSAISEYNKVRGRITQKHKFEGVDNQQLTKQLAEILGEIASGDRDSAGVESPATGE